MANQKKGTQLHYELFLIFERFRGFSVKEISEKLNKNQQQFSRSTLYNWHRRYIRSDRKARELTKDW